MQVLKFKNEIGHRVYFFSDLHVCHERDFILGPRGFKTAEESKETLIKNWNERVTNNDTIFLLGDTVVGAGTKGLEVFDELLRRLNYRALYVLPGNHPSGYTQRFDEVIANTNIDNYFRLTFSLDGFKTIHLVPNYFEIYVNGKSIVLSHYPILSYNGMNKGGFLLHGHSHGNLSRSEIGREYSKGKVLEVSPEVIGNAPISFDEVFTLLNGRSNLNIDHHG